LHLPSGYICFAFWEDGNEGPTNKIKIWLVFFTLGLKFMDRKRL
jgi:hypothetical protein